MFAKSIKKNMGSIQRGRKNHAMRNTRIAIAVLPPPAEALDGKPRGTSSLAQILSRYIKHNTDAVADKWGATAPALRQAGRGLRGQVNHDQNWRDPITGYHSNDIESEWGRFKLWYQHRCSYVRSPNNVSDTQKRALMQDQLNEYVFYVNVGSDIATIMRAFQHYNGQTYGLAVF